MNPVHVCVNTQPSDTNTIKNCECKQELKIKFDDNDFNIENNTKQSQYIDSNDVQNTKDNIKVENNIEIYENDKQITYNTLENLLTENKLTLKFDNDYHKEKYNENISHHLNIKSLLNLDVVDLVISNINVSNKKGENVENYYTDTIECEKFDNILNKKVGLDMLTTSQEINLNINSKIITDDIKSNKVTIVPEVKNEIKDSPLTGEYTPKDNKEMNSLRKFRKANKNPPIEACFDFEDNIKINKIHISNNIDIPHNIKTDDNNIISTENTSKESDKENSTSSFDEFDISFSSDEDAKSKTVNDPNQSYDSDSDYHSSDFEFIDEDEAKKSGYIVNNNSNKLKSFKVIEKIQPDLILNDYFYLPIENKYGNKESHIIPEGVQYISLFGGNYTPLPTLCVESKATNASTSMCLGCHGIGFDMRMLRDSPELEAHREEAHESERKILTLYPVENRRKRRRRY